MQIKNTDGFLSGIQKAIDNTEKKAIQEIKSVALRVTQKMMDQTPVWSGSTVRNYHWSTSRAGGSEKAPIGSGDPGPTGSMPLGAEPRRDANQQAALGEIGSLKLTSLVNLYGTNNISSDKWDLIDNGKAPSADRARNAAGVSKRAVQHERVTNENVK